VSKKAAVICTTFNKAQQVKRHIWCLAHQDYPLTDFVVLMVDDGSVDNTQEVLAESFAEYPQLNVLSILTNRKPVGFFGGMGLAVNIGLRYAEQLGVEYIFLSGGDILWPSYAISSHLAFHESLDVDAMVGQRQYFIRPDRESLGNDPALLGAIPDCYDWKPAEKLLNQPEALTIEDLPAGEYTYIGYPGDLPCDITHVEWPNLQSCKLEHWLNIGGYDEAGKGCLWEDEQLRLRLEIYARDHNFQMITHPTTECYHQPHPRQVSYDNRNTLLRNVNKYGYDVNGGQYFDWGRSKHNIIMERIRE
jgi:glycosyltransferase involved in cell wall biosynthesis